MRTTILRSACALTALTAVLAATPFTSTTLASSAGGTVAATEAEGLAIARSLKDAGRVVEARAMLEDLRRTAQSADIRSKALIMLGEVNQTRQSMTRAAVSLQEAQFAFDRDDLRKAELHANAVMRARDVSMNERSPASELLDKIALRRHELASSVDSWLLQAYQDHMNGNFAAAKAGVESIDRAALDLNQSQQRTLNQIRMQITELERKHGPIDSSEASLGVISAGATRAAVEFAGLAPAAQDGNNDNNDDLFNQANRDAAMRALAAADEAFEAGRYSEAARAYAAILNSTTSVRALSDEELNRIGI
ncbi:MAG: hypothetical protein ACNA8P_02120 [Phycisphaerales bacterium]